MNTGISVGSTSTSLLQRVKLQDAEAWRRLTDLYGPLIYSWCRRSGLSPADAADVFQEVCAAIFRSIGDFRKERPGDRFRGWLWTMTRNKIIDHIRRQKRNALPKGGTDANEQLAQVPEAPPSQSDASADDRALLRRGLEVVRVEFEDRTWQAFWRSVVEGAPTAEIAADLGMKPASVRQARSRVLRRLRRELGDLFDDLPL